MSGDICVMPDGNCSGCDHCGQDEAICTASPAFRDQCDNNCTGCEHCDEGEACEARKLSDIARHIPQMPGWA
jgi:hypothetical protein